MCAICLEKAKAWFVLKGVLPLEASKAKPQANLGTTIARRRIPEHVSTQSMHPQWTEQRESNPISPVLILWCDAAYVCGYCVLTCAFSKDLVANTHKHGTYLVGVHPTTAREVLRLANYGYNVRYKFENRKTALG